MLIQLIGAKPIKKTIEQGFFSDIWKQGYTRLMPFQIWQFGIRPYCNVSGCSLWVVWMIYPTQIIIAGIEFNQMLLMFYESTSISIMLLLGCPEIGSLKIASCRQILISLLENGYLHRLTKLLVWFDGTPILIMIKSHLTICSLGHQEVNWFIVVVVVFKATYEITDWADGCTLSTPIPISEIVGSDRRVVGVQGWNYHRAISLYLNNSTGPWQASDHKYQ